MRLLFIIAVMGFLQIANAQKREEGKYLNGKKEGLWLTYNDSGQKIDSTVYAAGRPKGISIGWYDGKKISDSSNYDGAGNGSRTEWWETGNRRAEGKYVNDTTKDGIWKYYDFDGKLLANEEYDRGVLKSTSCYDADGKKLEASLCVLQDASFPGGDPGWRRFLEQNLQPDVPVVGGAPAGTYTVIVQFVVGKDGSVADIKPLTRFGYGMERELVRVMKISPRWIPAVMYGQKVNAYRKQPLTFVVQEQSRRRRNG